MKINIEASKVDRLRVVIGSIFSVSGIFIILGLGAIFGYDHSLLWFAGSLLVLAGIFIAKSVELANFFNSILRF